MYERVDHEILVVEKIVTPTQEVIVKRHHTMYAHVRLTASEQTAVGQEFTLGIRLARWDDGETVTDYTPTLTVMVDGEPVAEVDPVDGEATVPLRFVDPGVYQIEVGCPTVQSAMVTIEVMDV